MLNEIAKLINEKVANANAKVVEPEEKGDASVLVEPHSIREVCKLLRYNEQYDFNVLQVISGVDYVEYIEVCYMLAKFDLENNYEIILKTRLTDRVNPELESVMDIWKSADWQERECYDMFGVRFIGHTDLRRILCGDDWEGYPLRKDYVAAKYYNGIEIYPDDKMNMPDREFVVRQKQIQEAAKAKATE